MAWLVRQTRLGMQSATAKSYLFTPLFVSSQGSPIFRFLIKYIIHLSCLRGRRTDKFHYLCPKGDVHGVFKLFQQTGSGLVLDIHHNVGPFLRRIGRVPSRLTHADAHKKPDSTNCPVFFGNTEYTSTDYSPLSIQPLLISSNGTLVKYGLISRMGVASSMSTP